MAAALPRACVHCQKHIHDPSNSTNISDGLIGLISWPGHGTAWICIPLPMIIYNWLHHLVGPGQLMWFSPDKELKKYKLLEHIYQKTGNGNQIF